MKTTLFSFFAFLLLNAGTVFTQEKIDESLLSDFTFRSVGPSLTSGRVIDLAVNPENYSEYYVAVASGGVWKTQNAGNTYIPLFDQQPSFSIGCVTIDPNNPHTVWVGTGENNSQRSVAYGDGVYRSNDGGSSWTNMGLKNSEHIGKILVDPRNSDVVYVAAQGPLWGPGGDRGLFKSTDGGKTWLSVLSISENTGISDIAFDPRNYDVIYVASYQRRRHTWTLVNGGEESAIYKSTNAGQSFQKLSNGLPAGEIGRIGIAVSHVDPDYIYALIEASGKKGGTFRSVNRGASWSKMSDYNPSSPQYYQELICDPENRDKIFSMDTYSRYSIDGGKTWINLGNSHRHVDDHALWINPKNTSHWLIGGDGGIYETWDSGKNWDFKENLPVTQFYRVTVDNSKPFYRIYGGTQDNNTIGGPSRTMNTSGITNSDWFITQGGDGFKTQIDPKDPSIVYSQSQHGYLTRFNLQSGERVKIQPVEDLKDAAFRWNWDSPLIISPHQPARLYFACNYLFRSDDRGNSWTRISPDLSRQLNRDLLPVMGKIQSVDAVAKNASTSQFGSIVSLSESPLKEDLLYVGTDDGLIQVSSDAGREWKIIEKFKGIPEMTYVSCILTSQHDANTVYACFNNHKRADFKPYILKSRDQGKTWESISSNLPENFPVYSLVEDHINPELLFVGGEFGVYVTLDAGKEWVRLKSGLPTISVKDMVIHKGENDLILGTFGRGFYILDNYSALRKIDAELLQKKAAVFPIENGIIFMEKSPLGWGAKGDQGENFFSTPNPAIEQIFTVWIKDKPKSLKEIREEKERNAIKEGKDIQYPSWDELRKEDAQNVPYLLLTIQDEFGNLVKSERKSWKKGIQKLSWDFRYASIQPASKTLLNPDGKDAAGLRVLPGKYMMSLHSVVDFEISELIPPTPFEVQFLHHDYLDFNELEVLNAFVKDVNQLLRVMKGCELILKDAEDKIQLIEAASQSVIVWKEADLKEIQSLKDKLGSLRVAFYGDETLTRRNYEITPGLSARLNEIVYSLWYSQSAPTGTTIESYRQAKQAFLPAYGQLKEIIQEKIPLLERNLELKQAPYTPGRFPVWERD